MAFYYPPYSESSSDYNEYSDETVYTIEILVEDEFAGAIIGGRGSNIRRMENRSDASIRLSDGPPSDPNDSLITISGTWEAIEEALTLLTDTVSSYSTTEYLTFKLIVYDSQCGRIIGSGGHKIRKIEDSTGASLYISPHNMTDQRKKKVVIEGDSESIPACIMKVLEIVIECPVDESNASSSQASPASQGSTSSRSVTLDPTTGPSSVSTSQVGAASTSTSTTVRNHQNMTGPSPTATPQVGAASHMDCRTFGELVTSEMRKLNSVRQSQLQSEILTSIAKFKKAETDARLNETVDECSICLDRVTNKTFIGECLHIFCYNCIHEWIQMRSTCPICVREIKSLLYNIRSNDDYDVYKFPDSQTRNSQDTAFVGLAFVL